MWPLLPNLKNKKVLCVGCGTGEEYGELLNRGAEVWGFDSSRESIKLAQEAFPKATFAVMDMHQIDYESAAFDFVYSGLTLHYTEDVDKVLAEMKRVLKSGGTMQFSVGHPTKWAAEFKRDPHDENKKAFLMGYDMYESPAHVYGDYLKVTKETQKPQNYPTITYWNRPISSYLRTLHELGLELIDFVEPPVVAKVKEVDSEFYDIHTKMPMLMVFVARKSN